MSSSSTKGVLLYYAYVDLRGEARGEGDGAEEGGIPSPSSSPARISLQGEVAAWYQDVGCLNLVGRVRIAEDGVNVSASMLLP